MAIKTICVNKHDILLRYAGDEFILFSNSSDALVSNDLYAVGCVKIDGCIKTAINKADSEMLKSKMFKRKDIYR